jgi:hypothetical protein
MVYPTKAQTRHIAGFTVVILLVATAGYVVTHTDADRLSMAGHRTHDVVLLSDAGPARLGYTGPSQHGIGMGAASGAPAAATVGETHFAAGSLSAFAADAVSDRVAFTSGSHDFSGSLRADTRSHSAGSAGFAGGFGMAGHGAWGGVSGHMPAGSGIQKAAATARVTTKAKSSKGSGHSGGSAGGASGAAPVGFAANGTFTASALGGDTVLALAGSPASSPSPTPEPMSLLLLGAGLGAVYQARRYIR